MKILRLLPHTLLSTYLSFLAVTISAQPQMQFWSIPPALVSYSSGQPVSSSLPTADYLGADALNASNCMYDTNGQLLFFVVDNTVFDGSGNYIDFFQISNQLITPGAELTIVPVPETCDKFYIIGSYLNDAGTAWIPFYALLDLALPNTTYPGLFGQLLSYGPSSNIFDLSTLSPSKAFDDPGLPNSERNRFGLAVSPFRVGTNGHFLFMKGFDSHTLFRYKITATGIFFDSSAGDGGILAVTPNLQAGGDGGNNAIYPELELVDLQNGNYRIGWISGGNQIFVSEIDYNSGAFITNSARSLTLAFVPNFHDQLVGLEFSPDGHLLYYSYRTVNASGGLASQHIGFVDLSITTLAATDMPNSTFPGSNTLGFSFIEMGYDGKIYYNDGVNLYQLATPNTVPSAGAWAKSIITPVSTQQLPDQIDGEIYQDILSSCCECNIGAMSLVQGDSTYDVPCNIHGIPDNFLTTLDCPVSPITISGNFGCANPFGEDCPAEISWELIDPLANSTFGSGGFPIVLPTAQVSLPGVYCLVLSTLCPGNPDSCVCKLRWVQPSCDSCVCRSNAVPTYSLVTNGNFSYGDNYFTSTLPSSNLCGAGSYLVSNSFMDKCAGWPSVSGLPGGGNNNFLIIDGNPNGVATLWSQVVNIDPCMTYCFSFSTASVYPPSLQNFNLNVVVYDGAGIPLPSMTKTVNVQQTSPPWSNHSFAWTCPCTAVGPFTLAINQTSGDEYLDFGIDDICFTKTTPNDQCCTDSTAFFNAAANVQTFGTLGDCFLNFTAMGLNDCMQIRYDWGDNQQSGVYGNNVSVSHTYSGPNTYTVCYTIEEVDFKGDVCWQYEHCEEVLVLCNTCSCGLFDNIKLVNKKTGTSQDLSCDNQLSLGLTCPPAGKPYKITGKLNCTPATCPGTQLHWELKEKNTTNIAASGNQPGPWFSITLDQSALGGLNGLYDLLLTGTCGSDTCTCVFHFDISGCPNPLPCPCDETFAGHVAAGFNYQYNFDSGCKVIFTPNQLTECDQVSWTIQAHNNGFNAAGTTTGKQSYTVVNFPTNNIDNYTICMRVNRPGTACDSTFCQIIPINCLIVGEPDCVDNKIINPGFDQNSTPGVLGLTGSTEGWTRRSGAPELVAGEGCVDPFAIRIIGKCWPRDIDVIDESIAVLPKIGFKLSVCYRIKPAEWQQGTQLVFNLSDEPQDSNSCIGECIEVARLLIPAPTADEWNSISTTSLLDGLSGEKYLTIHLENDLAYEDASAKSTILLDNICFQQNDAIPVVTGVKTILNGSDLRIFPNPTTGELTLELESLPLGKGELQILDLWGRVVQTETPAPGTQEHSFSLASLPDGVYFVKILNEGVLIGLKKVIKQ